MLVVMLPIAVLGCGGDGEQSLRSSYLDDIRAVDSEAFIDDDAALLYLKNFCEAAAQGVDAAAEPVDDVVESYCGTDLAAEVGVQTIPPGPANVDDDAFRAEALERFEMGKPEPDGSALDAAAFAKSLCQRSDSELADMKSNLGADWEGSFQQFAVQTYCPDRL